MRAALYALGMEDDLETAPTEFESCALAAIMQHQPCSAYEVRQIFARSTTPEWSGSTGSIYPAIERLIRQGLVSVELRRNDRRGRRDLRVTVNGEKAVRAWIVACEPWTSSATPDPIRTRVSFFDQLTSDAERVAVAANAESQTEARLEELRAVVEPLKVQHASEYLAGLGAIRQLEARRDWLKEVQWFYTTDPTPTC